MTVRGRSARRQVPVWLLAVAICLPLFLLTVDLGAPSLWDPDEGRHAEVAREMLLTREWLRPQLNFQPYDDRPPAYYWLLAAALAWIGPHSETALRLPSAMLAAATLWRTFAWGWRHLRPGAGALAAVALATTIGYVGLGRLAVDASPGGLLLALAILGMGEPLLGRRRRFPWGFYVPLAAAVLVLGPSAVVLPIAVAAVFVAWVREPGRLLDLRPVAGGLCLAALTGPVFGMAALHDPAYVRGLFIENSQLVFLDSDVLDDHSRSVLFFLALTPVLLLPWSVFLPAALRDAFRPAAERSPEARLYLLAWIAGDTIWFATTDGNLASSALTALVPLSLLVTRSLARWLRRPLEPSGLRDPVLRAGVVFSLVLCLAPLATHALLQSQFPMYAEKLSYVFLLVPVGVGGLGAIAARSRYGVLGAVAASGVGAVIGLYHFGAETVTAYNSMEFPANLIAERLPPEASIVSYGTTSHTLSFYSGRPVQPLDGLAAAAPLLNGDAAMALLTKERSLAEVRAQIRRPLYLWWQSDSKKILLANRPPPSRGDLRILLPAAEVARIE